MKIELGAPLNGPDGKALESSPGKPLTVSEILYYVIRDVPRPDLDKDSKMKLFLLATELSEKKKSIDVDGNTIDLLMPSVEQIASIVLMGSLIKYLDALKSGK